MHMHHMYVWCPRRSKEDFSSLELELGMGVNHFWVLGTELDSSERAARVSTSTAPVVIFIVSSFSSGVPYFLYILSFG